MTLLAGGAYAGYWAVLVLYAAALRRFDLIGTHLRVHLLLAGGAVMLLPFYWMVVSSLKAPAEAMTYPPGWWPEVPRWENYREAWNGPEVDFGRYFWVSIYTAGLVTLGTLFSSLLAAYAFARIEFRGKKLFFMLVVATLMVPGQVLLIPDYIIIARLGWLDTYKALVVPWLASVFSIFLMRQFMMTVPSDLYDAAQIDGTGHWRFLWHVMMPLSVPVIITTAIFTFIATWNSLLWPLVVTSRPEMRTLMVGLQVFMTEAGGELNLLMAASTFCVLPLVVAFFFLQRYLVDGIIRSGIK